MHSSPVRHSPPVRASSYCAAVRLACVRPTASVHSEPGSNSSLKTTCPKANALSCRSPTWQRIACFKTIDSLLDQNVCKMDSHPSCRRPHKIPAHTFKELRNRPQRLLPSAQRFRRSEPPIIAGFSASSTPFFKAATPKWALLPMPLQPSPEAFRRSEPPIMAGFSAPSTLREEEFPDPLSAPLAWPLRQRAAQFMPIPRKVKHQFRLLDSRLNWATAQLTAPAEASP